MRSNVGIIDACHGKSKAGYGHELRRGYCDADHYLSLFALFLRQRYRARYCDVRRLLRRWRCAPPALLGLILAFSSSLMMSLTHYGPGTAPIIFGSGYVTLGEWWKSGLVMSLINLLIWMLNGGAWWKLLGYW